MSEVQVTVIQGELKGKIVTTSSGFAYTSFQGIPYAKPPLGELRFQDPQPADAWSGVYDGTFERASSSQIDMIFTQEYEGSEDCLFLNVYSPKIKQPNEKLPVMFWIHGGGFSMGSGSENFYGADYLVDKNVILVTFNYRLGPLGFLCLNTQDNPGNAGIKDQVMALKWVKSNIDKFGGDSNNITIFGESAGGVSINMHVLSPMCKGLFTKAILQSGTCLNDWAIQKNSESIAFKLAEILGISSTNKDEVLKQLRKIPVEELTKASFQPVFVASTLGLDIPFGPVIEKESAGNEAFFSKCPLEIMTSGKFNKVPTMIGFTSKEGVLLYHQFVSKTGIETASLDKLVPDFKKILSPDVENILGPEKSQIVADKIKHFYFPTEANVFEDYVDMMTDAAFVKDINTTVKLFMKHSPPSYYYKFLYNGTLNVFKFLTKFKYTGASHGDELGYLFKMILPEQHFTKNDISVINSITEMWTNFSKFGNPTPQLSKNIPVIWKPATEQELNCLEINSTNILIQKPFAERVQFWDDIIKTTDNSKNKYNLLNRLLNKI